MHAFETDPSMRTAGVGLFLLQSPPDRKKLTQRVELLTRFVPRFRQKVVEVPLRISAPRYVVDPDFDLNYHLRWLALPPASSLRDLLDYVQVQQVQDLDKHRAQWEITVIEGLPDGGAALLFKASHTLTDAVGGIAMLAPLFDGMAEDDVAGPAAPLPERPTALDLAREGVQNEFRFGARTVRAAAGWVASAAGHPATSAVNAVRAVRSIGQVMAGGSAQRSALTTNRSLSVRCDLISRPLADLKAAGRVGGGKLNDAFVAAVAGGMRIYHERHGVDVGDLTMIMPINIRDEKTEGEAGNRWVVTKLAVPAGESDPVRRIQLIHDRSDIARRDPGLNLFTSLADVLTRMPPQLVLPVYKAGMARGLDLGTSNVPGPPVPLSICGAEIAKLLLYGPIGAVPTNLTLVSYAANVDVAVQSNVGAIPDGEVFVECMERGFDEVLDLAK
ncbi:hypothetical protein AU194_20555 [Mycobacterium sp. GA-2829]|nr:hypothetical protein AU194_20555 [Mycobacterium sp. GA-2829]